MPDIDLLIKTKGRGTDSIADIVGEVLRTHGFYPQGDYEFKDAKQKAIVTVLDPRSLLRDEQEVVERALPGTEYVVSVVQEPEFILRVSDAAKIGCEIAEGYLAGREGRIHKVWRHAAELADKVFSEGWPPSAPSVEFAVLTYPFGHHSTSTAAYSAKYVLSGGKAVLSHQIMQPRAL